MSHAQGEDDQPTLRARDTYMSPMKVPMSSAPNVLSIGGMWGRAAKGSAVIPVDGVAEGEDAVAMTEDGRKHSALAS